MACLAACSPRSIRFASSTSCAAVSRGTLPMSLRKSCSASVVISGSGSISTSGSSAAAWTTAICASSSAA
jgi:hypothetical protein